MFFFFFITTSFSNVASLLLFKMLSSFKISFCGNISGVQESKMNKKEAVINNLKNGLYIISTPIGNLDDLSKRAILVLTGVDLIICENPKHSIKLLNKLGIKKKLISLHDYNEEKIIDKISSYQDISKIGLISDAGAPLISDPGYKLVQSYIKKGIMITSIPGPSSLITSLQLSGLPINNFIFYGFLPKNEKKMNEIIIKTDEHGLTSIFFVSGKNLEKLVKIINRSFSDNDISICKELTKLNETIHRGSASSIYEKILKKQINLKGEFVLILAAKPKKDKIIVDKNIQDQISKLLKKYSLTETVKIVHNLTNISKNDVYKITIKIKDK